MQLKKHKQFVLLFAFMFIATWCNALGLAISDGYSPIQIKVAHVQDAPKNNSILASIDGHALTVVFTENLGTVHIEVTDTYGNPVEMNDMFTPNGYYAYIHNTGSYIVTFTLTNGDEYYGEFDVTD